MAKSIPAGNTAVTGAYKQSPDEIKREQDYRASNDVRALHEAHKIKKDPARHARAMSKMKAHMASLKSLMSGSTAVPKGDKETAADRSGPDSEMPGL